MMPLVSVIVPFYKGQDYIEECINSIINQDYKNLEVIIVNDGSPGNTADILASIAQKDSRIKILTQENRGVSAARNLALDNSEGDYICFVDQDDYIAKDYISYFHNLIEKYDADISLTPSALKFTGKSFMKESGVKDFVSILTGEEAALNMLYYKIIIAPWNKMISHKLIKKYNIRFNNEIFPGEGFNFSVDCFQRAEKIAMGHRKIYYYRCDNSESAMTKFNPDLVYNGLKAVANIKKNLVTETPELLKACRYANWHTNCDFYLSMVGSGAYKKYPELYKKLKSVVQKEAIYSFNAPISLKEKIKGLMYFINPYFASIIINHFRIRKFTKV